MYQYKPNESNIYMYWCDKLQQIMYIVILTGNFNLQFCYSLFLTLMIGSKQKQLLITIEKPTSGAHAHAVLFPSMWLAFIDFQQRRQNQKVINPGTCFSHVQHFYCRHSCDK